MLQNFLLIIKAKRLSIMCITTCMSIVNFLFCTKHKECFVDQLCIYSIVYTPLNESKDQYCSYYAMYCTRPPSIVMK